MASILFEAMAQLQLQEEVALDRVAMVIKQAIVREDSPLDIPTRKRFDSPIFHGCESREHANMPISFSTRGPP